MRKIFLALAVLSIFLISGCGHEVETKYVCADGTTVSNPSLCPKDLTPSKPEQPKGPTFIMPKNLCYIIATGSIPGAPTVIDQYCEKDSDCFSVARALGQTDMTKVKCS